MSNVKPFRWSAPLAMSLSLVTAACAQQPDKMSGQPTGSMAGMNMQGGGMSGMSGMRGQAMSGMNMQAMMSHCARMRHEMRQGMAMSADMHRMMAQCSQMDQQMGGGSDNGQMTPSKQ